MTFFLGIISIYQKQQGSIKVINVKNQEYKSVVTPWNNYTCKKRAKTPTLACKIFLIVNIVKFRTSFYLFIGPCLYKHIAS